MKVVSGDILIRVVLSETHYGGLPWLKEVIMFVSRTHYGGV